MKEIKEHNRIRALLSRWYSGDTSPDEERRLAEMLANAKNLPSDLEADKELFAELYSGESDAEEMPEFYSTRINEALENEMAADRRKAVAGTISMRKWILRVVSGVAVCLACAFFTMKIIESPKLEVDSAVGIAKNDEIEKKVKISDDTLQNHYLALQTSRQEIALVEQSVPSLRISGKNEAAKEGKRINKEIIKESSSSDSRETEFFEESSYLSSSDEAQLAKGNYRVVRDQNEADEIINSIFNRLESNVAMESSKISKIELEYDSEISRLSGIENVGMFKNYDHEKTPL